MHQDDQKALLKKIPSVDRLLNTAEIAELALQYPRNLIIKAIHDVLAEVRGSILSGDASQEASDLNVAFVTGLVMERVTRLARPSLRPVINATGIVVHTNLGRSILAERVLKNFRPLSGGYCNLEYDLDGGKRGSRYTHVEGILMELTGAEAATVVNNNAAAVYICLETLAKDREVVVSRGELVEIGGSFRIPDVMRKSGARMVEVGTTNKTHLRDYEEVIGPETGLLLKVHRSNFQIVGFTEEVDRVQLSALGRKYGIPVVEDLGSGCLIDLTKYGLFKEPTAGEVLEQGVDLVTFSGDKMLGGPQAGIILGRKDLVEAIKKNQLSRALRIDKLTLLALEETLNIYRDERVALEEIPTLKMITQPYEDLKKKARRLLRLIGKLDGRNFSVGATDGISRVGGGAWPLQELPSRLVTLVPAGLSAHQMEEWLRAHEPPVIVRVEDEKVHLDVRTIQESEMKKVAEALKGLSTFGD
ncbi:MAG: L-seryl-tRNA(Sec) selenium transferase [Deltaproteobacteria bacterium]|nr:L-seryl-tRNA(Sec) selenium transferase [Deltaproteobacteria bacterium]